METENSTLSSLLTNQNAILSSINEQLKDSQYMEALIVGLIVAAGGAVAAYLFNLLQKRQEEERSNVRGLVISLHDLISELEDLSLEYWLTDATSNDLEDSRKAIKIKSVLRLIRKYKDQYQQCNSKSDHFAHIEKFCSHIFDVATGDDFESPYRKKSRSKASKISRECTEAKAVLNEIKVSL